MLPPKCTHAIMKLDSCKALPCIAVENRVRFQREFSSTMQTLTSYIFPGLVRSVSILFGLQISSFNFIVRVNVWKPLKDTQSRELS